jgi:sucrose phosphorylase
VNRILSVHAGGVDVHQLNATYYSTLDCDDDKYVAARAIQLFARGVPQVYYVGLLAGENDLAAVARTGDGRAINRHDYTMAEIVDALDRPVVARIIELIKLRNTHPAFAGTMSVEKLTPRTIAMRWTNAAANLALEVDFRAGRARVVDGESTRDVARWES